jgi:hypothetical protein
LGSLGFPLVLPLAVRPRPRRSNHLPLCAAPSKGFQGQPYIYVPPSMQYNYPIPATYFPTWYHEFSRFCSSLGLTAALPLFRVVGLYHPCSLSMVGNGLMTVEAAAALQQCVTNKMAAFKAIEKKVLRLTLVCTLSSFSSKKNMLSPSP